MKLKYDEPLSKYGLNCNVRRYMEVDADTSPPALFPAGNNFREVHAMRAPYYSRGTGVIQNKHSTDIQSTNRVRTSV